MLPYVIGLFASLVVLCYYLLIKPHNYWKNRGVEVEKPLFIFGNWKPVAFKKHCASEYLKLIYDKYPGKRCVPLFQFMKPILLLRDPDLIKHVAVRNHDTFINRSVYLSKSADPVAASMMFFLQVNGTINCNDLPRNPVCDVENREYANICFLAHSNARLAYWGSCLMNCKHAGKVCGVNGKTYISECAAFADYVGVDYSGPCVTMGLITEKNIQQCSNVKSYIFYSKI